MNLVEGLVWAVVYSAAVLAPLAILRATSDAAVRRRAMRQWQDDDRGERPK